MNFGYLDDISIHEFGNPEELRMVIEKKQNQTATESFSLTGENSGQLTYSLEGGILPRVNVNMPDNKTKHLDIDRIIALGNQEYANRQTRLYLHTTDQINYWLYFTEMTNYDDVIFQNRFVKLLHTLDERCTLHIHIGNGNFTYYPIFSYGNIIDAIQRTRATVITHINGRASFSETCIWLFGHERVISEFSTLCFSGLQKFLQGTGSNTFAPWRQYFDTILSRAVSLNILTEKEKTDLMSTSKVLQLTYREVTARISNPNLNSTTNDQEKENEEENVVIEKPDRENDRNDDDNDDISRYTRQEDIESDLLTAVRR